MPRFKYQKLQSNKTHSRKYLIEEKIIITIFSQNILESHVVLCEYMNFVKD